jgi:hypothetical protein
MNCIAVLTRGYNNLEDYSLLIRRNKCIENNLINKNTDNLIFHEGNISEEQQKYIQTQTPNLNIIFKEILFDKEKEKIKIEEAHRFSYGYRHMCSFWFVDFWNYVKNYDYLLRIDEDCFINFNIDEIFNNLKTKLFISGRQSFDHKFVTIGLNQFSLNFFKSPIPKRPYGPYTNIFGLSLTQLRQNEQLFQYIQSVDESQMIYKRRWGDLPLWGEVIFYIFGDESLYITPKLKYYHESHKLNVN